MAIDDLQVFNQGIFANLYFIFLIKVPTDKIIFHTFQLHNNWENIEDLLLKCDRRNDAHELLDEMLQQILRF